MDVTRDELATCSRKRSAPTANTSASSGSATRTGRPGTPATSSTGWPSVLGAVRAAAGERSGA